MYLEDESGEDNSIWDDVDDPDYVQTPLMKRRTFVSFFSRRLLGMECLEHSGNIFCNVLMYFVCHAGRSAIEAFCSTVYSFA